MTTFNQIGTTMRARFHLITLDSQFCQGEDHGLADVGGLGYQLAVMVRETADLNSRTDSGIGRIGTSR